MLGERLRELRKNRSMTQEELGKIINVTKVSVSGYENGNRSPDTETLQKIADFFDVSTDYLLGRDDPRDELAHYKNKIAKEFPDADLMFEDMESLSADQLEEVYKFIKYQMSKEDDND